VISLRRSPEFHRRSALYSDIDSGCRHQTRFFAAAALVNNVLADLFAFGPLGQTRCSFDFLSEVGAALETANIAFAREIGCHYHAAALDRPLVCAEQARLQRHIQALRAQHPAHWDKVRRELNSLLNDRHAACWLLRCYRKYSAFWRGLRKARRLSGIELDFAIEQHRINIGLALIETVSECQT
jgi:hypothetical protein